MLTQGLTILVGRWAGSLAWRSAHVPLLRLKVRLVPTWESGFPLPAPSGRWLSVLPTWLGGITKNHPPPALPPTEPEGPQPSSHKPTQELCHLLDSQNHPPGEVLPVQSQEVKS